MEDWAFIMLFVSGLIFTIFLGTSIGVSLVDSGLNETAIQVPDCNMSQPLGTFDCIASSVVFFFTLPRISSSFAILNMIFVGFAVGLIFIFIKLIRGTG